MLSLLSILYPYSIPSSHFLFDHFLFLESFNTCNKLSVDYICIRFYSALIVGYKHASLKTATKSCNLDTWSLISNAS